MKNNIMPTLFFQRLSRYKERLIIIDGITDLNFFIINLLIFQR